MYKYLGFDKKGHEIVVSSDTIWHAKQEAAKLLHARHVYDIDIVLIEKDGEEVTQPTDM